MPGTDYEPIITSQLNKAVTAEQWAQALTELGRGLHVVQDQWAHDKNDGDIDAHGRPWFDGHPDNPYNNPENWARARQDTQNYIKDFMRARGLSQDASVAGCYLGTRTDSDLRQCGMHPFTSRHETWDGFCDAFKDVVALPDLLAGMAQPTNPGGACSSLQCLPQRRYGQR